MKQEVSFTLSNFQPASLIIAGWPWKGEGGNKQHLSALFCTYPSSDWWVSSEHLPSTHMFLEAHTKMSKVIMTSDVSQSGAGIETPVRTFSQPNSVLHPLTAWS